MFNGRLWRQTFPVVFINDAMSHVELNMNLSLHWTANLMSRLRDKFYPYIPCQLQAYDTTAFQAVRWCLVVKFRYTAFFRFLFLFTICVFLRTKIREAAKFLDCSLRKSLPWPAEGKFKLRWECRIRGDHSRSLVTKFICTSFILLFSTYFAEFNKIILL